MIARRAIFALLGIGAFLIIAEGTSIGIRYLWLKPDVPWFFRLMLPGMFIGLAVVLAARVWSRIKERGIKTSRPRF